MIILALLGGVLASGFGLILAELRNAPIGYQDDGGFHFTRQEGNRAPIVDQPPLGFEFSVPPLA